MAEHLYIEEPLKNQILVIPHLFTKTLCQNYIPFLATLPFVTTPGRPKRGEATRVNDRFQIDDPAFADRLWNDTALKDLINTHPDKDLWGGLVLGLNPNIRVYRYRPGQFFDQHIDESNRVEFSGVPGKTTWTLLIYLSGCEGGETVFYPDQTGSVSVNPVVGSALLHRHWPECLTHEGKEVLSGEKWVIRSDLVVER